jgi:uncharacterized protein (TIGR02270 family)
MHNRETLMQWLHDPQRTLWDVVDEHLEEASFLLELWEQSCRSWSLSAMTLEVGFERRLLAHLHGLILGGSAVAERILLPLVHDPDADPLNACIAALALLNSPTPSVGMALLQPSYTQLPQRESLRRAMDFSEHPFLVRWCIEGLRSDDPAQLADSISVMASRAWLPPAQLDHWWNHPSPQVQHATLRWMLACPDLPDRFELLQRSLYSTESTLRDEALKVAVARRVPHAWPICQSRVEGRTDDVHLPIMLLASLGDHEDHERVWSAVENPSLAPTVICSLAAMGTPEAVTRCLHTLNNTPLNPWAAASFATLTGVDLVEEDLVHIEEKPDDHDDMDEPLETDLERPAAVDVEAVQRWWSTNRHSVPTTGRMLLGRPLTWLHLLESLPKMKLASRAPWFDEIRPSPTLGA